jgi:hypothetical protein
MSAQPTPTATAPSPLLDAQGAGHLLSVPASWLMAEARADRVPHVHLGRYVRFDRDELLGWVATRARGPKPRRTGNGPVSSAGAAR